MKIVHLADLHLGYKAYNKLSSDGLNVREKDVLRTFKEALNIIGEINPDLIIMAGDIFHKPRPSNSTIYNTINLLKDFRESCNAPIIMIAGNHESVRSKESGSILKIFEAVLKKVKVVDEDMEAVPIPALETNILCVPYSSLANLDNALLKPDKNFKYNIMSIHGSYNSPKCPEVSKHESGTLIEADFIHQSEWDYIALGHYHTFTELASNCYYSGSIERTSTNIWKEAKEQKGFIEYDLDKKECKFHYLKSPRKVVDIKKIDADTLTGDEVDLKITEELSRIPDLEKSIVRLTIENLDQITLRGLDYKKIREFKRTAIHFRANFIKKNSSVTIDEKGEAVTKRKGLLEYLEEELETFELNQELNKEKFANMAKDYLQKA